MRNPDTGFPDTINQTLVVKLTRTTFTFLHYVKFPSFLKLPGEQSFVKTGTVPNLTQYKFSVTSIFLYKDRIFAKQ